MSAVGLKDTFAMINWDRVEPAAQGQIEGKKYCHFKDCGKELSEAQAERLSRCNYQFCKGHFFCEKHSCDDFKEWGKREVERVLGKREVERVLGKREVEQVLGKRQAEWKRPPAKRQRNS